MKKSDGAEQPTNGNLMRAGLGRITLWKSYAKRMLRSKPGHFQNPAYFRFSVSDGKVRRSGRMAQALKSAAGRPGLRSRVATAMYHLGFLSGGDSVARPVGERVLENLRAGCARYSEGRRRADGRGERASAVTKAPRRSGGYGMKKSDGAEQPTNGNLMRAGLGRITLWKSYALIRQKKQ